MAISSKFSHERLLCLFSMFMSVFEVSFKVAIPFGNSMWLLKIENGHRHSQFSPVKICKKGDFPWSCKRFPVCNWSSVGPKWKMHEHVSSIVLPSFLEAIYVDTSWLPFLVEQTYQEICSTNHKQYLYSGCKKFCTSWYIDDYYAIILPFLSLFPVLRGNSQQLHGQHPPMETAVFSETFVDRTVYAVWFPSLTVSIITQMIHVWHIY